jgi:hypothetical protein
VSYAATHLTGPFLQYFKSDYAQRLRVTADWIADSLQRMSPEQLDDLVTERLGRWGLEFEGGLVEGEDNG